jgi:hypothetical protein
MDRDTAFADMERLSNELFLGPDAKIGMQAFREKQRPTWAPNESRQT